MVFSIFKKTDPICGMKQEKEKGFIDEKSGKWFCSQNCKNEFYKKTNKLNKKGTCCGH